ncbi:hypothetical protein GJAV_G00197640 [Gymnothorax javanicus]|nr:hypothetical protein GJAV_G00197640 [Gymnothorax javanicus]
MAFVDFSVNLELHDQHEQEWIRPRQHCRNVLSRGPIPRLMMKKSVEKKESPSRNGNKKGCVHVKARSWLSRAKSSAHKRRQRVTYEQIIGKAQPLSLPRRFSFVFLTIAVKILRLCRT